MASAVRLLVEAVALVSASSHECSIIDTHVHNTFAEPQLQYTFPKAFPDLSRQTWNMSEFAEATGHDSRISAILMELDKEGDIYSQSLLEAKLFQEVAHSCQSSRSCTISGIIESAPVTDGAEIMHKFLPELLQTAPLVRGIREALWRRSTSSFVNETYWASLKEIASHNLTLDLLVNRTQLEDVAKLAAALPELRININHVGYPSIGGSTFDSEWASGLSKLAALPNVYAKLSGLPQAFKGRGWSASDFQPYVSFVLQKFGPRRTNFAGNWFVLNEYGDYKSMLKAVMQCLRAELDKDSIQEVMEGTARRLYRLDKEVLVAPEYV